MSDLIKVILIIFHTFQSQLFLQVILGETKYTSLEHIENEKLMCPCMQFVEIQGKLVLTLSHANMMRDVQHTCKSFKKSFKKKFLHTHKLLWRQKEKEKKPNNFLVPLVEK